MLGVPIVAFINKLFFETCVFFYLMDQPKMPRLMKKVQEQILQHPNYPTLPLHIKFPVDAAMSGFTRGGTEDNKFIRNVWKQLYLGESMPMKPSFYIHEDVNNKRL